MSNIYKITTGTTLFSDNNKKEKNEAENSFEGKMFYEVNNLNKNSYNFNSPIKTINVYRNNFFNYTNNNITQKNPISGFFQIINNHQSDYFIQLDIAPRSQTFLQPDLIRA